MEIQSKSPLMNGLNQAAVKKVSLLERTPLKYFWRAFLAGVYLSLADIIGLYLADQFNVIEPATAKLIYSLFFGWGLVMIIYLNGELTTSNMMYASVAAYNKAITWGQAWKLILACVFGNLVGSLVTAYLVEQTTIFSQVTETHYMFSAVGSKFAKPPLTILLEATLANVLVNIAIIGYNRIKGDSAKIVYLIFIIALFVESSFEHVIANFASFSLAKFSGLSVIPGFTWPAIILHWVEAFIGNFIGGGIIMGISYAWLNKDEDIYVD